MDDVTRDDLKREIGYAMRQIAYADERCTSLSGRDALSRAKQALTDALAMLDPLPEVPGDEELPEVPMGWDHV